MSEKDINFRDIPKAETTMNQNTIDIAKKINEIKHITQIKTTQVQLIKEFLENKKNDPETQKMIQIFKRKKEQENDGTEFNIPKQSLDNVMSQIERPIQKGEIFNIGEYMLRFEKQKIHTFGQEDINQIADKIVTVVDEIFEEQKEIFKGLRDQDKYNELLERDDLQSRITMFIESPRTQAAIKTLTLFFNKYLTKRYGGDHLNCSENECKAIAKNYRVKVANLIALTGDLEAYEGFKNSQNAYISSESNNYENIKRISLFKGDKDTAFITSYGYKTSNLYEVIEGELYSLRQDRDKRDGSKGTSSLSGKELEVLTKNVQHNEKKHKAIMEIYHIVGKINDLSGEKKYNDKDFYVYDDNKNKRGTQGKDLYTQTYGRILAAKDKFEAELESLKQDKKEGISSIIGSLQNNLENQQNK